MVAGNFVSWIVVGVMVAMCLATVLAGVLMILDVKTEISSTTIENFFFRSLWMVFAPLLVTWILWLCLMFCGVTSTVSWLQ